MKMSHVLGGRPKRSRKPKETKKRKQVKVALKIKGNVNQVQKAVQKIASGPQGAANGNTPHVGGF